jgi:hypothetical protein
LTSQKDLNPSRAAMSIGVKLKIVKDFLNIDEPTSVVC